MSFDISNSRMKRRDHGERATLPPGTLRDDPTPALKSDVRQISKKRPAKSSGASR